ncbi:MAG TPA: hypothetical protein VLX31_16125 [Streptosporangiaceae bacterium]|nr:hypothetical protein [Streptosporangiaceae bacterium]
MDWHPDDLPALVRDFAGWKIERAEVGLAWTAVTRSGTSSRVIAAHSLEDLRAKLEKAAVEGD